MTLSETSDSDLPAGKAGWIPIERWADRYRHRFCETERHRGKFVRAAAIGVVIVTRPAAGFPVGEMIFGMCRPCLEAAQELEFPREPL